MSINRLNTYQFAISQSISGSFASGDTVEASFLAKANNVNVNSHATQFVDLKYSVSSESISLQEFPKGTFPERFYIGNNYVTKSFVAGIPEEVQYIEFTLTGSLDATGSHTYNSGGLAYQENIELDYDAFQIKVHRPKTELKDSGLLVFTSPSKFIKADSDGVEIKGGQMQADKLTVETLEVFGDAAIFGDVTATANSPYTSTPNLVGLTGSQGTVATFARGDHQHALPFSTLNTIASEGAFTKISGSATSTGSFGMIHQKDDKKIVLGTGRDLQIYHSGTNSFIQDQGTGDLKILGTNLKLQDKDGGDYLTATDNAGVKIFFNESEKFETTTDGINVIGNISSSGLGFFGDSVGVNGVSQSLSTFTTYPGLYVKQSDTNGGALGSQNILIGGVGDIAPSNAKLKMYLDGDYDGVLTTYQFGSSLKLKAGVSSSVYENNWSQILIKDTGTTTSAPDGFIQFWTSGSQRAVIDENGNVGIGTTAPTKPLQVTGDVSASGDIYVQGDKKIFFSGEEDTQSSIGESGNSLIIVADDDLILRPDDNIFIGKESTDYAVFDGDNERLGIGTLSPTVALEVEGEISASGDITTDGDLFVNKSIFIGNGVRDFANDAMISSSGETLKISDNGNIDIIIDKNNTDATGKFSVKAHSTQTPRLVVSSSGDVGIGTSTPLTQLHIKESAVTNFDQDNFANFIIEDDDARMQITSNDGGNNGSALILSNVDTSDGTHRNWAIGTATSAQNNIFHIGYNESTSDVSAYTAADVVIDKTGQVGIGTSTPTAKLTIDGDVAISASGDIDIANEKRIRFAASDGTYSDDNSIRRADGEAIRFRYSGNSFIFDAVGDNDWEVRNSGNSPVFDLKTSGTGTSYFSGSAGKFLNLKHNTGHIGIGTTSPTHPLTVEGDISSSGILRISTIQDANDAGASSDLDINPQRNLNLGTSNSDEINIGRQSGTVDVNIYAGTSTTAARFITSTIKFNHPITASADISSSGKLVGGDDLIISDGTRTLTYDVSAGDLQHTGATLHINKSNGVDTSFDDGTLYVDASANRVSIGAGTDPIEALEVVGNISASGKLTAGGQVHSRGDDNGFRLLGNRSDHLSADGAFYRAGGQVYIGFDDYFYLRDSSGDGTNRFQIDNNGKVRVYNNLQVDSHITASGDISASGTIFASKFESAGSSGEVIDFNDNLNITGNITASGDISASGNINVNQITSSGDITINAPASKLLLIGEDTSDNHAIQSDANLYLDIDSDNDSSSNFFQFRAYSTNLMKIQDDGKVGIGTTTPITELEIHSDNSEAYHYPLVLRNPYNSETNLDYGVGIKFHLDDANDNKFGSIAYEAATSYANRGDLKFYVDQNDTTTPIATMTTTGLGIGTTSPDNALHISASQNTIIKLESSGDGDFDGSRIYWSNGIVGSGSKAAYFWMNATRGTDGTPQFAIQRRGSGSADGSVPSDESTYHGNILTYRDGQHTQAGWLFATPTQTGSSSTTNRFFISSSGNVGIGTVTPDYKLDVNGNVGINDFIYHNGDDNTYIGFNGADDIEISAGGNHLNWDTTGLGVGVTATEKLDIDGNIKARGNISSPTFESGFAGSGFRITSGSDGKQSFTIDDLTVRGTMSVFELLIHQIRATNGSLFVSNTAKLSGSVETANFSESHPEYKLFFDTGSGYGHSFQVGDLIRAQRFVPSTNGSGSQVFKSDLHITSVDATGSAVGVLTGSGDSLEIPQQGYEYVRMGSTSDADRQGSIYLTADDDNAPFIDVIDKVTAHSQFNTSGKVKTRIGKLDGITTSTFGTLDKYGFYASGSAYLEGSINATSGKIAEFSIDSSSISSSNNNLKLFSDGVISGSDVHFSGGKIADWIIEPDRILSPNGRLELDATSTNQIKVAKTAVGSDSSDYVRMYYQNTSNYGLQGYAGGNQVFHLGSTNQIAGFTISQNEFTSGDFKLNTDVETLQLGTVTDFAKDGSNKGLFVSGTGDFFIGAEDGDFIHFNASAGTIAVSSSDIQVEVGDLHITASDIDMTTDTFDLNAGSGDLHISSTDKQISLANDKIRIDGNSNGYFEIGDLSGIDAEGGTDKGIFLKGDGDALFKASNVANKDYIKFKNNELEINTSFVNISGSKVDIQTPKFFLGKEQSQFISGSNDKIEISSSNFHLANDGKVQMTGNVTMSDDVRIEGGLTLGALPELPSDENLLGYWSFSGISGSIINDDDTLLDNSGNNNNGTAEITATPNSMSFADGPGGTSIQFLSESKCDVKYTSDAFDFDHTDSFSLSIWVKRFHPNTGSADAASRDSDDTPPSGQGIFVKGSTGNSYGIMYEHSGKVRAGVRDSSTTAHATHIPSDNFTGSFHHVVMTIEPNSTTGVKLYVDSELKDTANNTGMGDFNDTNNLEIGTNKVVSGNGARFNGFLAEPRVYNKTLSASEVRALYLNPAGNGTTLISGDTISTGKIKSNNFSTTAGSQFNLDDSTFTLGGSSHPSLNFDGTNLTMSGSSVELLTSKIFLGQGNSNFISASNSNIEISSSGFHLKRDGSAILSGSITANDGTIGGFTISDKITGGELQLNPTAPSIKLGTKDSIDDTGGDGEDSGIFMDTSAFVIGPQRYDSSDSEFSGFRVLSSGIMTASKAKIMGDSQIAGFEVTDSHISASNLFLKSSGQITGSNVLFDGGTIGGFTIETNKLSSGNLFEISASSTTGELFISSSEFKVKNDGQVTGSNVLFNGGTITGDVSIQGGLTIGALPEIPSDDHLLGYWAFDESEGTICLDNSGNNNTGSIVGNAIRVSGSSGIGTQSTGSIAGNCLFFDDAGDMVQIDSGAIPDSHLATGDLSITAWINLGNSIDEFDAIVAKRNGVGDGFVFDLRDAAGENDGAHPFAIGMAFDANASGSGVVTVQGNTTIAKNEWTFVSATIDRDDTIKLYVNGEFDIESGNISAVNDSVTGSLAPLCIGGRRKHIGDSIGNAFNGYIDEVRIYDKVLTANEVRGLYLSPSGTGTTRIAGDQITTGKIQSNNLSTSAGSEFNLDDGTFKLGGTSAPDLEFDGTSLKISGSITASSGLIGGFETTATQISASDLVLKSNGELTASNAKITGDITATTGNFTADIVATSLQADSGSIGGFIIGSNLISASSGNLILKSNGQLTGSAVSMSGTIVTNDITADGGTIGGFTIGSSKIQNSTNDDARIFIRSGSSNANSNYAVLGRTPDSPNLPVTGKPSFTGGQGIQIGQFSTAGGFNGKLFFESSEVKNIIAGFEFDEQKIITSGSDAQTTGLELNNELGVIGHGDITNREFQTHNGQFRFTEDSISTSGGNGVTYDTAGDNSVQSTDIDTGDGNETGNQGGTN